VWPCHALSDLPSFTGEVAMDVQRLDAQRPGFMVYLVDGSEMSVSTELFEENSLDRSESVKIFSSKISLCRHVFKFTSF
jgi:hypothetical protein